MKNKYSILIAVLCIGALFFTSCDKDETSPVVKKADEINLFIWSNMHDLYLWNEQVPNLTNTYYNNNEDSLKNFLNRNTDHSAFFYDLLYQRDVIDKWSWIVDDYEVLEKEFEGITKSMGYNFRLAYADANKDKLIGYVLYVVKGTPADAAGIKRGYLFTHVNNQQLTASNYVDLLLNSDTYTLTFDDIINNTITPNGKTANLTAVEVTENPIFLDTVYNINSQKIGYLVYNSFVSNYDKELNNVFLNFKTEGISKLILDLRYNGGGAVSSAIYLSSMIYGTYTDKLFLKTQYNKLVNDYYTEKEGTDYFNMYFASTIVDENNSQTPINTLNLLDLYIITTDNTASASEIVINCLNPYMTVTTVGTNTTGKYVASMTIKDYIDDKGTVNPNHKWALQPIVLKISNSQGVSDFVNGFTPKVVLKEDITNLSVLGDLIEPLLNATVATITGGKKKSGKISTELPFENLPQDLIHKKEMHIDNIKLPKNK